MDLDTPRVFIGLYRLFRRRNLSRRASLRQAWRYITHRL